MAKCLSVGRLALLFSFCASPAWAILTAGNPYASVYQASTYGNTYEGVALISVGCSGALFGSTRVYVLTAAHCVADHAGNPISPSGVTVLFQNQPVAQADAAAAIYVDPGFLGINNSYVNDIAVIQLATPEPSNIPTYSLYGTNDAIGKDFTLSGWAAGGTGTDGPNGNIYGGFGTYLRVGFNTYTGYAAGDPTHLEYTFESGAAANNAACYEAGIYNSLVNPYTTSAANLPPCPYSVGRYDSNNNLIEGFIDPGDSGGPSFYNGQIVGVHSYGTCVSYNGTQCASSSTSPQGPDYNTPPPNQIIFDYGEIGADTNVSLYTGANGFLTQFETATPEPASIAMTLSGAVMLAGLYRRRRQAAR